MSVDSRNKLEYFLKQVIQNPHQKQHLYHADTRYGYSVPQLVIPTSQLGSLHQREFHNSHSYAPNQVLNGNGNIIVITNQMQPHTMPTSKLGIQPTPELHNAQSAHMKSNISDLEL
eukprot:172022_1